MRRRVPGAPWEPPVRLVHAEDASPYMPDLAVDANGDVMLVWYLSSVASSDIWAARFTEDEGWGEPVLAENASGRCYAPHVAVDALGRALVVFVSHDGLVASVMASRFVPGDGFGDAVPLETSDAETGIPFVAMNASGGGFAVWQQGATLDADIVSARFTEADGWDDAVLVEHDETGPAWYPRIGVDATGVAMAVWEQSDFETTRIRASRFDPSIPAWGEPVVIETSVTLSSRFPALAVNAVGDAVVTFSQNQGSAWRQFAVAYEHGFGWRTPTQIDHGEAGESYGGTWAAIDDAGRALAVYRHEDGGRTGLWVTRYERPFGWSPSERIDAGGGSASEADVAVGPTGDAVVAFSASDWLARRLWATWVE